MSVEKQRTAENIGDGVAVFAGLLAWTEVIAGIFGAGAAVIGFAWVCLRVINFYRVNRLGKDPWLGL